MLAGYSYLGYISDKKVSDSALHAIDTYGLGTHGTRPNCGTTEIHLELESLLCQVTRSSSATLFPSGFQANISTIAALVGKNDIIMGDELNHASIVDGCKLSPAEFRAFKHNSLDDLKRILKESGSFDNRLIIVDSIFSMDGDMAPVPELCQLCDDYTAVLMVDEAHSFGVLGESGFGITEYFNLSAGDIDVITGVLSKTIPGTGGYACGTAELGEFLKHNANSYIFSGSISPYSVAVAIEAIRDMVLSNSRVNRLWANKKTFHEALKTKGMDIGNTCSPITPIILGGSNISLDAGKSCMDNCVFLVPVPFPLVPMGKSRLRATVTADHLEDDLLFAAEIIADAVNKARGD